MYPGSIISRGNRSSAEEVDALVIGAGAGGATITKHLAQAGLKVMCLEQGGWISSADAAGGKPEWELLAAKGWHLNPNVRARPEDYPCEVSGSEVYPLMFSGVGGSTIHYAGEWARLAPSDFCVRSLDDVADDWPISYDELAPFYEQAEQELGVAGLAGDPAYPPSAAPPLPALPIGKVGRRAAEGMNQLGWHWWPGTTAIASQPWGRQSACTRRGVCMFGCPEGAKGSMDVTTWPDALQAGARLVTRARVSRITVDERGRATGADWVGEDGAERHQAAAVVFLACNGVGTPRLLLLSESRRFPQGLANSSGLVGRRLMMHPAASILGEYEEGLDSWLGPQSAQLRSWQFYETDWERGFPRGAMWTVQPVPGPLEMLARVSRTEPEQGWGTAAHDVVSRFLGRSFEWMISAEDMPNPDNRVTLDGVLTDSSGLPAPRITYQLSDWSRRNLDFQTARAREAHEAAGAVSTRRLDWMPESGWHLLGTARMGDDPERSVVDKFGAAHDVPNLYLVDGSVFVTSGSANPTATICANALRVATHVVQHASTQVVPS